MKNIVTIDPGVSGGIAYYINGKIHAVKMPKGVQEMDAFLKHLKQTYGELILFIEKVQAFGSDDDSPGKKYMINKMLANYSQLLTVIQLNEIPFVQVYPISWQSALGLMVKKDKRSKTERKNSYKTFATNCFPEIKRVTLATSDALCLVQFALLKISNQPTWINERLEGVTKKDIFN